MAAFIDISDIVNFLKNRIILLTCDYIYLTYRMISTQERKKRFSFVKESCSFQIRNKLKNCRVCNTYIFVDKGKRNFKRILFPFFLLFSYCRKNAEPKIFTLSESGEGRRK